VNGRFSVRRLDLTLNPNSYDAHTLAELFNPETAEWMVLDPTFDLSVKRTGFSLRSNKRSTNLVTMMPLVWRRSAMYILLCLISLARKALGRKLSSKRV